MKVAFDYEVVTNSPFGKIYRPIAKVELSSPSVDKSVDIWMIVDTGADYTIIPRHFVDKLRISLEHDCIKDITFGVGGEQSVYFLKKPIKAKIGALERSIPLAFFGTDEVPALLGRLGFLETFDTEFLKGHKVVFNG